MKNCNIFGVHCWRIQLLGGGGVRKNQYREGAWQERPPSGSIFVRSYPPPPFNKEGVSNYALSDMNTYVQVLDFKFLRFCLYFWVQGWKFL